MKVKVVRLEQTETHTLGALIVEQEFLCLTLERPWCNNEPSISCIPKGIYTCMRINSPHFGDTFEVKNVPNRSHILFHKGNIANRDSKGCILLGSQIYFNNNFKGVLDSKKAFDKFYKATKEIIAFDLEIV